ncbi:pseudouridine synthase [Paucibacter sp. JuS9]|uniref:pseudouridine synthase n=1 Tax=Paucibacter sp. JuS9 TaxID=3228748 RepID=UPI0037577A9F
MLNILHLDDALVAIDKPPGLLVHRTQLDAHEEEAALQKLRDQLGRPVWPVHRLDKGTSGVLLFALDADTASAVGQSFERGEPSKRYLALVRGWPAEDTGAIDHPLSRDPEQPSTGQPMLEALTHWRCLARAEWSLATDARFPTSRFALMELRPETGRRHQIRRHLKHMAHPIVGDATHGKGPLNRAVAAHLGVQRLWLHALELRIWHPGNGEALVMSASPGPEWSGLPGIQTELQSITRSTSPEA